MQNIRLIIEYEGTHYRGWQVQKSPKSPEGQAYGALHQTVQGEAGKVQSPKSKTIQGVLEEALSKITKERIRVIGAGRTDAGVHALGQVANFKTKSKMTPEEFKKALNSMLPRDIVIKNALASQERFHAQFNAKSKYYRYIIYQGSTHSPFIKNYTRYIRSKLNLKAMREGAKYLVGKHNFSSFQLSGSSVRTPVRTITKLSVTSYSGMRYAICDMRKNGRAIFINVEADGFLYGMVRSIVGTLIEVGRGKISPSKVKEILKARNRRLAGPTAPAKGLCLVKVRY